MIRVPQVRVVDEEGLQLGVMPTQQALGMAQDRGFDLVEVAPMASPPVVRFLDFGQFKYEQTKRDKDAKRRSRVGFKEVRLSPKIGIGDFQTKVHRALEFLEEGDRIKVTVRFRGRELTHPELGRNFLAKFTEAVKDHATVERPPILEGKSMFAVLASTHKPKVHEHGRAAEERTEGEAPVAPEAAAAAAAPESTAPAAAAPESTAPAPTAPEPTVPTATAPEPHRTGRQGPGARGNGARGTGGRRTVSHQRPAAFGGPGRERRSVARARGSGSATGNAAEAPGRPGRGRGSSTLTGERASVPKVKTHKGTQKRVGVTGSGKFFRVKSWRGHHLEIKSSRRTRRYAGKAILGPEAQSALRRLLPHL